MTRALAGLLLAAIVTPAPSLAGDVRFEVTGVVSGGSAPTSGPLVGAAVGDAVSLVYEARLPANGFNGQAFMWLDAQSFALDVGGAVETLRMPSAALMWMIDDVAGIDGVHLRGEALATLGLRLEMRLEDTSTSVFSSTDPLIEFGTWDANVFDGGTWHLIGASLQFEFQSLTITPLPVGTSYCGPAVVGSSGRAATISATGSDRRDGDRLRLAAAGLPAGSFGYFLVSDTQDFVVQPGGSLGNLCLGGTVGRFQAQVQNAGAAGRIAIEVDLLALPGPNGTFPVLAGESRSFQAWFRDTDAAGNAASNFSDGLEVAFL